MKSLKTYLLTRYLPYLLLLLVFFYQQQIIAQDSLSINKEHTEKKKQSSKKDSTARTDDAETEQQEKIQDSSAVNDSAKSNLATSDTLPHQQLPKTDTSTYASLLAECSYYPFYKQAEIRMMQQKFKSYKSEVIFYFLFFIVFMLSLMRFFNKKYFDNLFVLFSQTAFRQNQTREQMMQDKFSSLIMNFLFVCTTSLLLCLITLNKYSFLNGFTFLQCLGVYIVLVSTIYIAKFIFLQFLSWLLHIKEVIQSYVFLVYLTNKIMGIILLPLIAMYAFGNVETQQIVVKFIALFFIILLLYRAIVGISIARNGLHLQLLHFLIYICAAEIMPLLILFKAYTLYIDKILS